MLCVRIHDGHESTADDPILTETVAFIVPKFRPKMVSQVLGFELDPDVGPVDDDNERILGASYEKV